MGHRKAVGSGVWTLEQLRVEARSTGDQNCDSHPSQTRDVTRLRVSTDLHRPRSRGSLINNSFIPTKYVSTLFCLHDAYIC